MAKVLTSADWTKAGEKLRESKLSTLGDSAASNSWDEAFKFVVSAVKEERIKDASFAANLCQLDEDTDYQYDLLEMLEKYFDHFEALGQWEKVVEDCNTVIRLFAWKEDMPSQFMFRKGNALEKMKRYDEAEAFGQDWLEEYPDDLYAAASNVYLMLALKKYAEAEKLTKKYLREDLVCDDKSDTFLMAAYRLYEMTNDINAKQRVEKKMADYHNLISE